MICSNCGSLQDSNVTACSVCGYEFDMLRKPSNVPAAKKKLNKWEMLLIIFWPLLILIVLYLLAPYIIAVAGKSSLFLLIFILAITIFGITRRGKWAYYFTFSFCILLLLILLRGLITSSAAGAPFILLMIIILPMLFFAWKAYKEINEFK